MGLYFIKTLLAWTLILEISTLFASFHFWLASRRCLGTLPHQHCTCLNSNIWNLNFICITLLLACLLNEAFVYSHLPVSRSRNCHALPPLFPSFSQQHHPPLFLCFYNIIIFIPISLQTGSTTFSSALRHLLTFLNFWHLLGNGYCDVIHGSRFTLPQCGTETFLQRLLLKEMLTFSSFLLWNFLDRSWRRPT